MGGLILQGEQIQAPAPVLDSRIENDPSRDPVLVYIARSPSAETRRTIRGSLEAVAAILAGPGTPAQSVPWWQLRYQHTQTIRARLVESGLAPATVNKHLAALRGVLKETWRLGLITAEDYHRAADVANVRGSTLPAGRYVSAGEIQAVLATCARDTSTHGLRDGAILATLYGCGLRRAELCSLTLAALSAEGVRVMGKGRKERLVPCPDGTRRALGSWLDVRGQDPGPLFQVLRRSGEPSGRPLKPDYVLDICKRRAGAAGVEPFSPHDMRRTMASDLLDAGIDIAVVRGMLGHADIQTTARYDRRGQRAAERASGFLSVPWRAPEAHRPAPAPTDIEAMLDAWAAGGEEPRAR